MTATIMQALDTTIANVALPYMQGSLSASLDQISWVLTSYIVAAAVMTAPVGWLADRFGRKKLFIVCVGGFTVASLLCALSQNIEQIVAFRLLQGMCGAALVPLSQSVMLDAYPIEQRGQAMGIWGMGVMLGPIMGPTLGGFLTENYSWHWVFLVNLPVGILTVLGLLVFMDETKRHEHLRFDWFGFVALAVGIGALQLMLDRGEQLGWFTSPEIVAEAIVSVARLLLFLRALADDERAVRALRDLPRPQLPDRLLLHGDHGADAVLLDGAVDAVHPERARLSDHHRRLGARLARHRHAGRHADDRPAAAPRRGALPHPDRADADRRDALPDDRLHRRTPRRTRSSCAAWCRASAWASCSSR